MTCPPTIQLVILAKIINVKIPNAMTISVFTPSLGTRNTDGPGFKPSTVSIAKIKKIAAALPGIPSDSTGIKFAPETAEFAASVEATPSIAPSPKARSPF